jgi:hypothetical protein
MTFSSELFELISEARLQRLPAKPPASPSLEGAYRSDVLDLLSPPEPSPVVTRR